MSSAKARETSLWTWLRKGGKSLEPGLHMTRIENLVGEGTPDVEGFYNYKQFWCELKAVAQPAKPTTLIDCELRTEQLRWHRRRYLAGCENTWILIQVGSGINCKRFLINNLHIKALRGKVSLKRLEAMSALPFRSNARKLLIRMAK